VLRRNSGARRLRADHRGDSRDHRATRRHAGPGRRRGRGALVRPGDPAPLLRGESISIVPAHRAKKPLLVVANARHSTSYGCALRLDQAPFDVLLVHAWNTLSLWAADGWIGKRPARFTGRTMPWHQRDASHSTRAAGVLPNPGHNSTQASSRPRDNGEESSLVDTDGGQIQRLASAPWCAGMAALYLSATGGGSAAVARKCEARRTNRRAGYHARRTVRAGQRRSPQRLEQQPDAQGRRESRTGPGKALGVTIAAECPGDRDQTPAHDCQTGRLSSAAIAKASVASSHKCRLIAPLSERRARRADES